MDLDDLDNFLEFPVDFPEELEDFFGTDDTDMTTKSDNQIGWTDVFVISDMLMELPPRALVHVASTCARARAAVFAMFNKNRDIWWQRWFRGATLNEIYNVIATFGNMGQMTAVERWDFVNANFIFTVNTCGYVASSLGDDEAWTVLKTGWYPKDAIVKDIAQESNAQHVSMYEHVGENGSFDTIVPLDMAVNELRHWTVNEFLTMPLRGADTIGDMFDYLKENPQLVGQHEVDQEPIEGIGLTMFDTNDYDPCIGRIFGIGDELATLLGARHPLRSGQKQSTPDDIVIVGSDGESWDVTVLDKCGKIDHSVQIHEFAAYNDMHKYHMKLAEGEERRLDYLVHDSQIFTD